MNQKLNELWSKYCDRVYEIRHHLHMHPELGFKEYETSKLVVEELEKMGIPYRKGLSETGVVAVIEGGKPGKTVALRADMDALSINEESDCEFKSKVPGVMHACGHDGHTAGLLGVAMMLNEIKDELCGNVKLIFQPGEEVEGGALPMIQEGALEEPKVDAVFGGHLWGSIEAGKIAVKHGAMMASPDVFTMKIIGKGGHGGVPSESIDPIPMMAQIIEAIQTLVSRKNSPTNPFVISCGSVHAGTTANNVVPEFGTIQGTVRTFNQESRDFAETMLEKFAKGITEAHGGTYEFDFLRQFPPLINDNDATDLMAKACKKIVGDENVFELENPTMGAEDFSYFAEAVPSSYVFVGIADDPNSPILHHNAKFAWKDEHMKNLALSLAQVAIDFLDEK